MLRCFYIIIIFLFFFVFALQAAERKIQVDSLKVNSNDLILSYHIDGLLSNNTIQGLERGLTSEVLHHVRLWKRKKLFSAISAEVFISIKLYYDNWEDKFRIITDTENRLTTQVETVREFCSQVKDFPLIDVSDLEIDNKYYISIETIFKPVSAETYQDLSEWLSGSSNSNEKEKPKKSGENRVFGVLLNAMGFGDKVLTYKSKDFIFLENNVIQFLE